MEEFDSADALLDFAIAREEETYVLYTDLAGRMKGKGMSEIFKQFAMEELGHKTKLQAIKGGGELKPVETKITDLKIGDYLVDVKPSGDLSYQDTLILAMKMEKSAFKMYNDLAATAANETLRNTFLMLAQEEAKHKLRFEIEYDSEVMKEN